MSSFYKSLPELDREIERCQKLLTRPNYRYKNMTNIRIDSLKRARLEFTWPLIWQLRVVLSGLIQTVADWVSP